MNTMHNEAMDKPNKIWPIIFIMVLVGFALIFFLGTNNIKEVSQESISSRSNVNSYLVAVGVGVLIAGAFFSAGGLIGFLFGIPKLLQNTSLSEDYVKANKPLLVQNDNLVQVSDWLTKIIVGVGLTQLNVIPSKIFILANNLGVSFSSEGRIDDTGRNSAIAIILYFSIIGFFATYLWTRLFFGRLLLENENELKENLVVAEEKTQQAQRQLEIVKEDNKLREEDIKAVISTFSSSADDAKQRLDTIKNSVDIPDDPQKNKWGGNAEVNGRKLLAVVRPTSIDIDWFNVSLEVISTDTTRPLTGEVTFHLHPSFPNDKVNVQAQDGTAKLELVAFGAFTVGVECDLGATKLELDLSELPDAPAVFKGR